MAHVARGVVLCYYRVGASACIYIIKSFIFIHPLFIISLWNSMTSKRCPRQVHSVRALGWKKTWVKAVWFCKMRHHWDLCRDCDFYDIPCTACAICALINCLFSSVYALETSVSSGCICALFYIVCHASTRGSDLINLWRHRRLRKIASKGASSSWVVV